MPAFNPPFHLSFTYTLYHNTSSFQCLPAITLLIYLPAPALHMQFTTNLLAIYHTQPPAILRHHQTIYLSLCQHSTRHFTTHSLTLYITPLAAFNGHPLSLCLSICPLQHYTCNLLVTYLLPTTQPPAIHTTIYLSLRQHSTCRFHRLTLYHTASIQ